MPPLHWVEKSSRTRKSGKKMRKKRKKIEKKTFFLLPHVDIRRALVGGLQRQDRTILPTHR
jgi:hypothetical protein